MVKSSELSNKYGFLITKPLQLMVVLSLLEQLPKGIFIEFLIVDYFDDAEGMSDRLSKVIPVRGMVKFFRNHKKAYRWAVAQKYENFFIDSDVGFLKNISIIFLSLLSSKTILSVYEEGYGSYRNDLYTGLKGKILERIGCGIYFGGNWFTKELYIYNPEKYTQPISAKKIKIHKNIGTLLNENKQMFDYLFNSEEVFKDIEPRKNGLKKCSIYLSSWNIDHAQIEYLRKAADLLIIKPHPHLRGNVHFAKYEDVVVIKAGLPAEMLILWICGQFETVEVYHHNSSVIRYIQELHCTFRALDSIKKN